MDDEKTMVSRPFRPGEGDDKVTKGPRRPASDAEQVVRLDARQGERPLEPVGDETLVERRPRAPAGEPLLGWVVIKNGRKRGQLYALASECTIGRKAADILLEEDSKVSRIHAKMAVRDSQFVIVDVLSDNGTFVNGERINSERVLQENDEIRIGDTVLVLKTLPPGRAQGPQAAGTL